MDSAGDLALLQEVWAEIDALNTELGIVQAGEVARRAETLEFLSVPQRPPANVRAPAPVGEAALQPPRRRGDVGEPTMVTGPGQGRWIWPGDGR